MPAGRGEEEPPGVGREEVEPVEGQVDSLEEGVRVAPVEPAGERRDLDLGVDRARDLGHDLDLRASDGARGRAVLPVRVRDVEGVEVGDLEPRDPETEERREVNAARSPEPGDRDARGAEALLLGVGQQALVPRERGPVVPDGGRALEGDHAGTLTRTRRAPRRG